MSYETWKNDYNADPAVVGSTFWVNTKPVTVVGVAPQGFYGDRLVEHAAEFLSCHSGHAGVAGRELMWMIPTTAWLYIVGRVKPGLAWGPLQEKIERRSCKRFLPASKVSRRRMTGRCWTRFTWC